MTASLIGLGTFVTQSKDDTTPDIVEYEGYFVVAERIIRIDKSSAFANHPTVT